jgi:hypothetical protein
LQIKFFASDLQQPTKSFGGRPLFPETYDKVHALLHFYARSSAHHKRRRKYGRAKEQKNEC